mmetsp:Transcript_30544/g.55389  ORF Transcript_30544/g.55389 Transcript_30544/m.55389 type:complete len:402 (+) Transcript_30544:418-1623(+)
MPSSAKISCHASFSACFSALDFRCFPSPPCALSFLSCNITPCFFMVLIIPARLAEKLSILVPLDKSNNRFAAASCSSRVFSPSCSKTSASNLLHRTSSEPSVTFTVTHLARTCCTFSSKVTATFLESLTSNATACSPAFCCVSDSVATILEPFPFLPFLEDSPPCSAIMANSRSSSSCSAYFFLERLFLDLFPRDSSFSFFGALVFGGGRSFLSKETCFTSVVGNDAGLGVSLCSNSYTSGEGICSASFSAAGFAISSSICFSTPISSSIDNFSIPVSDSLLGSAFGDEDTTSSSFSFSSSSFCAKICSCSSSAKSLLSLACLATLGSSPSRNSTPRPISNELAGKKFFRPRIMKEPTVRYSPVGAVFDTWCDSTQYADVTIFELHAAERQIVNVPASRNA